MSLNELHRIPHNLLGHLAIQRGRRDMLMAHQFLDRPHPDAPRVEPGRKGSATRMRRGPNPR